jgi:hypothetical protein
MGGGVVPDAGARGLGTVLIYPPVTLYCEKRPQRISGWTYRACPNARERLCEHGRSPQSRQ